MTHAAFCIGLVFYTGTGPWRCKDCPRTRDRGDIGTCRAVGTCSASPRLDVVNRAGCPVVDWRLQ
jgi:hypothetical protein